MANEFIARKGLIVLANGAKVTGSLGVQGDINATGYNVTASNLSYLVAQVLQEILPSVVT
jgi:hypothetical protein